MSLYTTRITVLSDMHPALEIFPGGSSE